jgi:hypothetical protein
MKTIPTSILAASLLGTLVVHNHNPKPRYTITDLNNSLPSGWSSQESVVTPSCTPFAAMPRCALSVSTSARRVHSPSFCRSAHVPAAGRSVHVQADALVASRRFAKSESVCTTRRSGLL